MSKLFCKHLTNLNSTNTDMAFFLKKKNFYDGKN